MFTAKNDDENCNIRFEAKEYYRFDTTETRGRIITYETFIGSNDVKFTFARGQKIFSYMFFQKYVPQYLFEKQKMEKADDVYDFLFEKKWNWRDRTMALKM